MNSARVHPESIGPYRILDTLGEGGMGTVYLAEHELPVQRRVALKVIKLGLDTKQALARFELEQQALALMDHPHVARVYDAGATPEGQPWFAMELVHGEPIDAFCARERLPVRARVELFRQVCAAVQHAHVKGIVHRDLKPSNVLVGTVDGQPVAKIIDFGVARALEHRLTEETLLTERGQMLGTLEYMSPEQADPTSIDVDTRTDVYSLGVILYQLLAGRLPFDPTELRAAGFLEMLRSIREVSPPLPSTRVLTVPAGSRGPQPQASSPRNLSTLLRGELDWIVMKALEKDRRRRYQSAGELSDDLERYLCGDAVLAGPPSALYRLRKLIARRKGAAAAVAAVSLSLAAGLVISYSAWRDAAAAQDVAQAEAAKASRVAKFAREMVSGVDPSVARGMDTKLLRAILDESTRRVASELHGQPDVEIAMRETLAASYSAIASFDEAERHLDAARALARRELGERARETLALDRRLLSLRLEQGRYAEAEQLGRATLAAQRAELGESDLDVLRTMTRFGVVLTRRGGYAEAETLLAAAVEGLERAAGPDDLETLDAVMNLAVVLHMQPRSAEAAKLMRRVVEGKARRLGPDHAATLLARGNLAMVLGSLADPAELVEAERVHRECVADLRRIYGPEHPNTLRGANNLALHLARRGNLAGAAALHKEIAEVRERTLGPDDPMTLLSLRNLGDTLMKLGRLADAEAALELAYERGMRARGNGDTDTLHAQGTLARLRQRQARYRDAAELFVRQAEELAKLFGERDSRTECARYSHAAMLQDAGDHDAAEPVFRKVLECHGPIEETPPPWIPSAQNGLGRVALARGAFASAEASFREALAVRRRIHKGPHSEVADSLHGLGTALLAQARARDALPVARELLEIRAGLVQTPPAVLAEARGLLGECLCALGDLAAAEPLLVESQEVLATAEDAARREAARRLAVLYEAQGKADEAKRWSIRAKRGAK